MSVAVLLIDDDPIEAKLLDAFLRQRFGEAFALTYTASLEAAIELLAAQRFDHVLLDNRLPPYRDHRETLPMLKGHTRDAETIVVSASPDGVLGEGAGPPTAPFIDKFELRRAIGDGLLG